MRTVLVGLLLVGAVVACRAEPREGPAPRWLVQVTGIYPEDVEARRLERQAAFERGDAVPAPDPTFKWLADTTGLTAEVRAARLRHGLDPDTGQRLDLATR